MPGESEYVCLSELEGIIDSASAVGVSPAR